MTRLFVIMDKNRGNHLHNKVNWKSWVICGAITLTAVTKRPTKIRKHRAIKLTCDFGVPLMLRLIILLKLMMISQERILKIASSTIIHKLRLPILTTAD